MLRIIIAYPRGDTFSHYHKFMSLAVVMINIFYAFVLATSYILHPPTRCFIISAAFVAISPSILLSALLTASLSLLLPYHGPLCPPWASVSLILDPLDHRGRPTG